MRPSVTLFLLLGISCSQGAAHVSDTFVLATTTSTQDSGLLDVLVPAFEKAHPGLRAKVVAVGSGEALELGRRGDADVLLAHSPDAEKEFIEGGFGRYRKPVMRNNFQITGPPSDPAKVHTANTAVRAFQLISSTGKFVSRGDESGTHTREIRIWKESGVTPGGGWYFSTGQGMAESLLVASEVNAYILTDSATFTVMRSRLDLVRALVGDALLINPYHVIPVTRARRTEAAEAFAGWIVDKAGQAVIESFGRDRYGSALFEATAESSKAAQ